MNVPTTAEVVAAADLGTPTARKTGRNPAWPYVPVIIHGPTYHGGQEQIRGKAFATRDEAIRYAADHIARQRAALAGKLADPRHRALREQHGLPRDLENR